MRTTLFIVMVGFITAAPSRAVAQADDPAVADDEPYVSAGILVASSHRSYAGALRAAQTFSRKAAIPYDSRGLILDEERGLIWPDDSEDDIWAGQYAPRRYDECVDGPCVTIERSDGYEGFKSGLYIVVAGITRSDVESASRLASARRHAPGAYVRQTVLYMGCMH